MIAFTRMPIKYATGAPWAALQPATDACQEAREAWLPIWQCGGPLDATDHLPTGLLSVSHGMLFFILTHREG